MRDFNSYTLQEQNEMLKEMVLDLTEQIELVETQYENIANICGNIKYDNAVLKAKARKLKEKSDMIKPMYKKARATQAEWQKKNENINKYIEQTAQAKIFEIEKEHEKTIKYLNNEAGELKNKTRREMETFKQNLTEEKELELKEKTMAIQIDCSKKIKFTTRIYACLWVVTFIVGFVTSHFIW